MDQATVGATLGVAQGFAEFNDVFNALSALTYIGAFWFGIKTVLSLSARMADPRRVPRSHPAAFAFLTMMLLAAPTLLLPMAKKKMWEKIQPTIPTIAEAGGTSAQRLNGSADESNALIQQTEHADALSLSEAVVATKVEKLETIEQARSLADRKALFEVLFGLSVAVAIGAAIWFAGKRRRESRTFQDLPEVRFFDSEQGPRVWRQNAEKSDEHEAGGTR